MKHKYVRHSTLGFVLWPMTDEIWHQHVGRLLAREAGAILSAGFAEMYDGSVSCYGKSESLGISSDPTDTDALAKQLGLAA